MGTRGSVSRTVVRLILAGVCCGCLTAHANAQPAAGNDATAPRPVAAPTAPVAPVAPVADYVVGPQDVLTIAVYGQNDLNGQFRVDADGTFTFPLVGRVKAGDLTVRQLEGEMGRLLKEFIRE